MPSCVADAGDQRQDIAVFGLGFGLAQIGSERTVKTASSSLRNFSRRICAVDVRSAIAVLRWAANTSSMVRRAPVAGKLISGILWMAIAVSRLGDHGSLGLRNLLSSYAPANAYKRRRHFARYNG